MSPTSLVRSSPTAMTTGADRGLAALGRLWLGRWRHRRALASLHPEQMHEVGLNPEALRREACRPFWRG